MRPPLWHPPIELSMAERTIIKRIRRAKLFVCLRHHRHELFPDAFQQALATLYKESSQGYPPVPPAQLALATILQAYTRVSDDEVIEVTTMDRRWQLVLDCLDSESAPFSKGTLVALRQRLMAQQMDRRLLERTGEVAAASGACGARQVRAALARSPLWGAGRVADTYNLLGHALRKAVGVIARQQGRELPAVAREVGAPLVRGSSLKAALEVDWDEPTARQQALTIVLEALSAVDYWLATQPAPVEAALEVAASVAVAHQGRAHGVPLTPNSTPTLRQGVAEGRRMSVEDGEMRHGRKSRSLLIDGYKRYVLRALDSGLIVAVGMTPANVPEASVTEALETDLAAQQRTLTAWHIDRAYLARTLGQQRSETLAIFCKAWPVHQGPYVPTSAFHLDWDRRERQCPGGVVMPFEPGGQSSFRRPLVRAARCVSGVRPVLWGVASAWHRDEALLAELRERQRTPHGRAKLRARVAVEHALAHIGHWQGRRARYRGVRKNVFALRRCAVVHNLHVLARLTAPECQAA